MAKFQAQKLGYNLKDDQFSKSEDSNVTFIVNDDQNWILFEVVSNQSLIKYYDPQKTRSQKIDFFKESQQTLLDQNESYKGFTFEESVAWFPAN